MIRTLILAAFIFLNCGQLRAQEQVDALVITALDVSSSINAQETMLQVEGMAQALRSPAFVQAATHGQHGRIAVLVFVWADGDHPELAGWRIIAGQADADGAAAELTAKLQALIDSSSRSVGTLTNLSGALDHARSLLQAAPFRATRRVVNIVGNGEDNVSEDPQRARAALLALGATINGVVLGGDPAVLAYYRNQVIGGRGAFCMTAARAEDLTTVLVSKFVADLAMVRAPP
jgi:hypothetical protein